MPNDTTTGNLNVTINSALWLGQDGKKYGPYSEGDVRQWLADGTVAPDALAWREGMPEWVPLSHLLAVAASEPPTDVPPAAGGYATAPLSAQPRDRVGLYEAERADFPPPPSLHWGLVLLLGMLTFGIFAIVWPFVQARWVRRIDERSKATVLLGAAFVCWLVGEITYFTGLTSTAGSPGLVAFGGLLLLVFLILYVVAYFAMAGSMRRRFSSAELPLEIGGITLFFFTLYYLQAQLSWLARWRKTGQTVPKASKAVFWVLFFLLTFFFAMLAAIAIPAYQDYVVRAQVTDSMVLATQAETAFSEFYRARHDVPMDNMAAGLVPNTSLTGKYVSSLDVSGGKITVAFNTLRASAVLRDKVLILTPTINAAGISWNCSAQSTVPNRDLPPSCRR